MFEINSQTKFLGISGGIVFVPVLITIGQFPTHYAKAISAVIATGNAIATLFTILFFNHPLRKNGLLFLSSSHSCKELH